MNVRPICLILTLFLSGITQTRAQINPNINHPWYITINAGYTINRAGGSLFNLVQDLDRQYGIKNATQKNGGGFEVNVHFQRQIFDLAYIKTGLGYIQKQVNPEENSYPLYKDSLKTGYLSIPVLFGVGVPLNESKTFRLMAEVGPTGNVKLIDKSYHGPDRAGFKTYPVVLGLQAGAGIAFKLQSSVHMQLLYTYRQDITHAYDESLYWGGVGSSEPIRTRSYIFKTSSFSVGLQWPLK